MPPLASPIPARKNLDLSSPAPRLPPLEIEPIQASSEDRAGVIPRLGTFSSRQLLPALRYPPVKIEAVEPIAGELGSTIAPWSIAPPPAAVPGFKVRDRELQVSPRYPSLRFDPLPAGSGDRAGSAITPSNLPGSATTLPASLILRERDPGISPLGLSARGGTTTSPWSVITPQRAAVKTEADLELAERTLRYPPAEIEPMQAAVGARAEWIVAPWSVVPAARSIALIDGDIDMRGLPAILPRRRSKVSTRGDRRASRFDDRGVGRDATTGIGGVDRGKS